LYVGRSDARTTSSSSESNVLAIMKEHTPM
jgi:hypothetical protein